MQDFKTKEPLLDRPIAFHRAFIKIVTNCPLGALYLSQAWFWRDRGKDLDGWVYKTHTDFTSETGLSKKQQIRIRGILQSKSWWEEKVSRVGTVPTFHFRIDRIGLLRELSESAERELSESAERELSESAERELSESAERELSIYKDPKNTNKDYCSKITSIDPDRAHENSDQNSQLSEPSPTTPEKPTPKPTTLLQQSISGEEESFAACRTTETNSITATGYLAQTEKRYSPTLTRQEIAEITQALIDTYNKTKPACWGTCTQITAFLTSQVTKLLDLYQEDLDTLIAIKTLKNDVAAAHLSCKGDDFYDKPSFGLPSIAFFLEPKRIDKLRNRAQVWYDRSQQQKEQVAHRMVRDAIEGVPDHQTGKILSQMILYTRRTRFKKLYDRDPSHPDLPSIEHLQLYYPEIFA